jgi:methyl-accepting chemotaxis protein
MRLKIGGKLALFGSLVIIVSFSVLSVVVTLRANKGISELSMNNLSTLSQSMANAIEDRFQSDVRLCISIASDRDMVAAATLANSGKRSDASIVALSQKLTALKNDEHFKSTHDVMLLLDAKGIIVAASRSNLIGLDVSKREYYQNGIAGTVSVGQMMKSADGVITAAISAPVKDAGGKAVGVCVISILTDSITNEMSKYELGKSGYVMALDRTGLVIMHPNPDLILKSDMSQDPDMKDVVTKALSGKAGVQSYVYKGVTKETAFSTVPSNGWVIMPTLPRAELLATATAIRNTIIVIAIVAIILSIIIFILFAQTLSTPIKAASAHAMTMAEGNLVQDVPQVFLDRGDEIGSLAAAFKIQRERLRDVATDISFATQNVAEGSRQLSATSQQLSQGATEQAASIEEISSSMEQMSSNIRQNAENAQMTGKIAMKSAKDAEEGGVAVTQTVEAMRFIASKIGIIEEIARSTNMLALNASIEAARAGEYGKGFAVVASEVGKLADRSQKEAGEISKLSSESVKIAELAGTTINAMIPDIKRTADLVQEISASSTEQDSGAQQISQAILQLDQVVQQNASASEEAASMAEELSGQAEQLKETISFFKLEETKQGTRSGGAKPVALASAGMTEGELQEI